MNALLIFYRGVMRKFSPPAPTNTQGRILAELRHELNDLSSSSEKLTNSINKITLDLGDYAAENWKKEKEASKKYLRIVEDLLLVQDHLENMLKPGKKSKELAWIHNRIRQLLEEQEIMEIHIHEGAAFNSYLHLQVKSKKNKLAEGTIIAQTRKGYYLKGENPDRDVVLRPAEVIVSDGPRRKPTTNPSNEVVK